jgi:hypothetical protein
VASFSAIAAPMPILRLTPVISATGRFDFLVMMLMVKNRKKNKISMQKTFATTRCSVYKKRF